MEAISSIGSTLGGALGKVGSVFKSNPKLLPGIFTGVGTLTNFLNSQKQNSYLSQQLALQKEMTQLMNNPAALAQRVNSLQQPLNANLIKDVGNQTQGYLMERGLAESPQISEAVLGQALAPYEQQNQQMAIDEAFRSLGLPFQGSQPQFPPGTDLTGLLKLLMTPSGGGAPANPLDPMGMGGPNTIPGSTTDASGIGDFFGGSASTDNIPADWAYAWG